MGRRAALTAATVLLLLCSIAAPLAEPGLPVRILVSVGPPAMACAVAVGLFVRAGRQDDARAAASLVLGYGGAAVAHLVYQLLWASHGAPVFPSVADAVFVVSYVFLAAGFAQLGGLRGRVALLDATLVVASGAIVVASVLVRPQLMGSDPVSQSLTAGYPLLDCLLLVLAVQGCFSKRLRGVGAAALVGGCLAMLVGDTAVLRAVDVDPAWLGVPFSVSFGLLALAHLAMTGAGAHPAPPSSGERRGEGADTTVRTRLVLLPVASCIPSVALVLGGVADGAVDWPILGVGSVLMALVTAARLRHALFVMERQRVRLAGLATTDELTGLLNRREFATTAATWNRSGKTFAVGLLDLDHFKRVNDELGHAAGDQVLRDAAAAWGRAAPPHAQLFRWGGEEFVVLFAVDPSGRPVGDVLRDLDRMRRATPSPHTVSAGLAMIRPGESVDDVLRRADVLLYEAKTTRNTICSDTPRAGSGPRGADVALDG